MIRAQAAQADGIGRRRERIAEVLALREAAVLYLVGQRIEDVLVALLGDFIARQDGDGRWSLQAGAGNPRTGDHDGWRGGRRLLIRCGRLRLRVRLPCGTAQDGQYGDGERW
ncbi:hypothetical protein D3C72_1418290 [compost metagenome]